MVPVLAEPLPWIVVPGLMPGCEQRDYVSPEDVQSVIHNVLRHRVLLSFEAEAEGISSDDFIRELIKRVPVS